MKFIYLTAKTYPASTADHVYIRELAEGFHEILKANFSLVVANNFGDDLASLPVVNLRLSLNRFRTLYYFFWLPRFILRGKHTGNDTVFFSNDPNLLALLIFWKNVLRAHYKICSDWHMLFGGSRDRFIMRGSDALIATSEKLKKAMIAASGAAQDKILVAYGGIDLELYTEMSKSEARTTTHLPQDKKIVAYVGFFKTMGMEKGIRTMIESLTTLPEEVVMLFVGGKDDEISEYRTYADTLGVTGRCIFVGRKSQSELAIYEAAADVLAIPYPDQPHYRDFGFPMKVYEYMASNRPIVYSKLDLVEEVLTSYAKGFTADDATDFAKAVLDVLGDYAAWSTKAAEAAQNVTNYSWKRKAEKILNFLQL